MMKEKRFIHLRTRYGISKQDFFNLYNMQSGLCAGCGEKPKPGGRNNCNSLLFVDHDHKTGDIRGLLCQPCNSAIGLAKDSSNILLKLSAYLMRKPMIYFKDLPIKDRGSRERSKTHCKNGHEYSGRNLIVRKNNTRVCRSCSNEYDRKRYIKRKELCKNS